MGLRDRGVAGELRLDRERFERPDRRVDLRHRQPAGGFRRHGTCCPVRKHRQEREAKRAFASGLKKPERERGSVTTIDNSNGTADARPGLGHVPADYYRQFGPIAVLLADDRVTEIMVNGTQDVYAEIAGQILLTNVRFSSEQELLDVMHRTVEAVGRRLDEENPICDARLADR